MSLRDDTDDSRFASNTALRGEEELGVAGVSQNLFEKVTQYHAQIGANVDRNVLQQLEWNLLGEAKALFHQKKFEEALNTFTHCLAVTEKTRSATDHAVRGAVIHNIASCLHNLGEMEAAQAYYDQAIEAFRKARTPMFERFFYGDANRRRIDFVKERLVDITWGRKPDGDKYLDENGQKRAVPEALTGGGDGAPSGQALSERWREDGPSMPSWMGQGGADGGYGDGYRFDPNAGFVDPYSRGGGPPSQAVLAHEVPHVSSAQYLNEPAGGGGGSGGGGGGGGGGSVDAADAEQEAARKEWLNYHMQVGEWAEAAELVVTREEKEDLEYLQSRAAREGRVGGVRDTSVSHQQQPAEDDGML